MPKSDFSNLLFDALLTLKTREEVASFFSDACTPKEIDAIAQRFAVAKMLDENKVYNEIIEKTGASTATVSRVRRSINEGFRIAFKRLEK